MLCNIENLCQLISQSKNTIIGYNVKCVSVRDEILSKYEFIKKITVDYRFSVEQFIRDEKINLIFPSEEKEKKTFVFDFGRQLFVRPISRKNTNSLINFINTNQIKSIFLFKIFIFSKDFNNFEKSLLVHDSIKFKDYVDLIILIQENKIFVSKIDTSEKFIFEI
jgi:hypothetical protein